MSDTLTALVAATAIERAKKASTLKGRIRLAMENASTHFFVTNRAQQLDGAIAAILTLSTPTQRERIKDYINKLVRLCDDYHMKLDKAFMQRFDKQYDLPIITTWNKMVAKEQKRRDKLCKRLSR